MMWFSRNELIGKQVFMQLEGLEVVLLGKISVI